MSTTRQFHTLKVSDIRRETQEAVSIGFAVPEDLQDTFRFTQGQHLTLRAVINGQEERRSYSICSGLYEDALRIAVKQVPEGKFSTFCNTELSINDELDVMPPMGHFHTPLKPQSARHHVAFAAGSGITPILSLLKTTLEEEPNSSWTLVYSNRATESILFLEELEDLKNRYMHRLTLVHLLSREAQDWDLLNGRLDESKADALLDGALISGTIDQAYLCGPFPMIKAVETSLLRHGLTQENIHYELFQAPEDFAEQQEKRPQLSESEASHVSQVQVKLNGKVSTFDLQRGAESILEAALKTRADVPFACKGGVCCTCRAKVIEGEVEMDLNYGLEPAEIEQNFVLTCQSHPVSDRVVLDFDQ